MLKAGIVLATLILLVNGFGCSPQPEPEEDVITPESKPLEPEIEQPGESRNEISAEISASTEDPELLCVVYEKKR